jgi:hypothetical protein
LLHGRGVPKQHKCEMKIEQAISLCAATRLAYADLCLPAPEP